MTLDAVTRSELAASATGDLALTGPDEPALRTRARPLAPDTLESDELAQLVRRLWSVLDGIAIGVGLAAPQVGLPYAIFLADDRHGLRVALANPRRELIVPAPDTLDGTEGCLSWPSWQGRITRPVRAIVRGHVVGEGMRTLDLTGFGARILDHEMDHLNGRLYIDRVLPGTLISDAGSVLLRPVRKR